MNLRSFEKRKNRKELVLILGIFVLILILLIGKSYAIYQSNSEVIFINAKVRFPNSSEVSYTTTSNSSVTNIEQALNNLYKKVGEMYE